MRLLIAWSNISGYAAACWRALAQRPGIDLRVVAFAPAGAVQRTQGFHSTLLDGLSARLIDPHRAAELREALGDPAQPDVAVVAGWRHPELVRYAFARHRGGQPTVGTLDLPWTGSVKQRLQCVRRRRLMQGMVRVVTASAASAKYAHRLGANRQRVVRGLYGFDDNRFRPIYEHRERASDGWPRQFVFAGRMIPEKAVDVLVAAYRRYRAETPEPWPLRCAGRGPEAWRLRDQPGVEAVGFVGPDDMPGFFGGGGVMVMPSRSEPWGVALAEAMGTGLPAIATSACHAALDLVDPRQNGLIVSPNDPAALAEALASMHRRVATLPEMGALARQRALPFTAEAWAARWHAMIDQIG